MKERKINRRQFLKKAAPVTVGAIAFPHIVPSAVFGKNGRVAPSNKILMGCVGVGWMGAAHVNSFLKEQDCRIVAVCDVDTNHLNAAKDTVDKRYGNNNCVTYHNFHQLLAREDIDAVSLALPDHWHAIPAILAAESGKDIYGEKPFSHTLAEGRAMCEAVKRYERIWQTGSWQRSVSNFRFACELVLNGCIGRVHRVEVGLPSGNTDLTKTNASQASCRPPDELDYDFWLGPAPYQPYCPARVHKNWRWHLDYGGGQLMDWVGHHVDIAHWGLGLDYTGPVEIQGYGEYPKTSLWNAATRYRITAKYHTPVTMIIAGGYNDIRSGTKWIGENGWVWVNRGDAIDAYPKSLLKKKFGPGDINLYRSPNHYRNFLDCVRSRSTTLTPCEIAHRSASVGHIGQIAMLLERRLKWDPENERFINDAQANRLLSKSMRSPWHL